MKSTAIGRQAVVIGAGMGGLAAARALADHFEQVLVLERDSLPAQPVYRKGTPQAAHVHALMAGGRDALVELFVDFDRDLTRVGAVPIQVGRDIRWEAPGYDPFPRRDLGLWTYAMSRPLIELVVRRSLEQHRNVTLRQGCRAQELVATPDGGAVTAIRCRTGEGRDETIAADLVIDASGRGVGTLDLLASTGRPRPEETTIGIDIGYSTAVFEIPNESSFDWKGVMTWPQPPESTRYGAILPLEGGRWIATLAGRHDDKPPGDTDGFFEFARQLRTPTVHDAIKHAKRLSDVSRFNTPVSVVRHFEKLKSFPRGLLAFGDAICRFSPVYGQGMSVAAQEACLLGRLLRVGSGDPLATLAGAFFAQAWALIESPWAMTAVLDLVYPQTSGQRPPHFDRWLKFQAGVTRLAAHDPAMHKLMVEVQNLLKPRSVYGAPETMRRVLAEAAVD